ncbi:glycoside hydrolase family 2 [Saccharomonospora xinjiangensis]|uniref:Beta-galactosidase/beta-glucuronidase n=1 Tax=Saccharomonospora xinjiangensis XJ-54 TaxID=882086 RepID=I0UXX4_9PSEU|nr:glycoside hydrolase family 2 [Saccharomonospora xinjiangensis]EID52727.1 beta-galactosidase/beta-glucuronidase [Saccharomonospora xinjiangensis XJ-54]
MLSPAPPPRSRDRRVRRRGALAAISALLFAALTPAATAEPSAEWTIGEPPLATPWTGDVSPGNALPEYPRPQLTRPEWRNLNGVWEFTGATEGESPPFGETLPERILVPYPTESALSGIQRRADHMWYRRTVTVPRNWRIGEHNRLLLHFGAVDYEATVYVNGHEVASHTGGYDAFSADITDALRPGGEQEIVVGVTDLTDATWQPVGKQRRVPDRGIFYEGASGIWQTVWMEPVAETHITTLDLVPDIDTATLGLTVNTEGPSRGLTVEAVVRDGERVISRARGEAGLPLTVAVPDARLWSPDSPFLYDLDVVLKDRDGVVDRVSSYFGMREIGMTEGEDGKRRITLNGEILFLMSTLDQGYWPDGIYTAPTDEALRWDLEAHKRLGFNTVRKHIKTEPDRWYYHADRLGLLVWQDMPSMRTGGRPPADAAAQFESELRELVAEKKNWTSIIGWVPFNEGWGEWAREDTGRIAEEIAAQDPTRLVNAHSGVNCCDSLGDSGKGHVIDWHAYVGPATPEPDAHRVAIDGEHGGFGLEVDGHMWFGEGHAYHMLPDSGSLTAAYVDNQRTVLRAARSCGISGAVYTQLTDVEHEVNGFFTYDRMVEKMDFEAVRRINEEIIEKADGSEGGQPAPLPGTPGLDGVHAYLFDEGTGSVAEDAVGDADATLTGTEWTDGVRGGAASFAGAGEADTGAALADTRGSYSVSAWVRLDEAGTGFQTVVSQDTDVHSAFFLQYSGQDQRWAMSFAGLRTLSPEKPEPGRWYHLTGVRDAEAGTLSLYVDGQHADTRGACLAEGGDGNTVIGRARYGGADVDHLRGDVDEVRIFDRALSRDEVALLASGGR